MTAGAVVGHGAGGLRRRSTTKSAKVVLPGGTDASAGSLQLMTRVAFGAGCGWLMTRTWLVVSSTSSTFCGWNCTNGSPVVGSIAPKDEATVSGSCRKPHVSMGVGAVPIV